MLWTFKKINKKFSYMNNFWNQIFKSSFLSNFDILFVFLLFFFIADEVKWDKGEIFID